MTTRIVAVLQGSRQPARRGAESQLYRLPEDEGLGVAGSPRAVEVSRGGSTARYAGRPSSDDGSRARSRVSGLGLSCSVERQGRRSLLSSSGSDRYST